MWVLQLTSVNSEHDYQLKAISGKNILLLQEFQGGINCSACKVWVKQSTRKENPTEQNQTQKQETKPRRAEKINAVLDFISYMYCKRGSVRKGLGNFTETILLSMQVKPNLIIRLCSVMLFLLAKPSQKVNKNQVILGFLLPAEKSEDRKEENSSLKRYFQPSRH